MTFEFKLPDLGEGIHEGEIVEVFVSVGDKVTEGDPLLEVETDKAVTAIPSPYTGAITEVRIAAGDTVHVGDVLIVFEGRATVPAATEEAVPGPKPLAPRAASDDAPSTAADQPVQPKRTKSQHS